MTNVGSSHAPAHRPTWRRDKLPPDMNHEHTNTRVLVLFSPTLEYLFTSLQYIVGHYFIKQFLHGIMIDS